MSAGSRTRSAGFIPTAPAMEVKWLAGVQKETTAYRCKSGETDRDVEGHPPAHRAHGQRPGRPRPRLADGHFRRERRRGRADWRASYAAAGRRTGDRSLLDARRRQRGSTAPRNTRPTSDRTPPCMVAGRSSWRSRSTRRGRVSSGSARARPRSAGGADRRLHGRSGHLSPLPARPALDLGGARFVRARFREASTVHVAAHPSSSRSGSSGTSRSLRREGSPPCGLDIVDDWLVSTKTERVKEKGAAAVHAYGRSNDGSTSSTEQPCASCSLQPCDPRADETDHAEPLEKAKALGSGGRAGARCDRGAPRRLPERPLTADDLPVSPVARSARIGSAPLARRSDEGATALPRDELGRAFLFDGATFAAVPLAIDTSERRNTAHFQALDTCDERRLFLPASTSGGPSRGTGGRSTCKDLITFEPRAGRVDPLVSCGARMRRGWIACARSSRPRSRPRRWRSALHCIEKKGWLFAWAYDSSLVHPFGHELSRASTARRSSTRPGTLASSGSEMIESRPARSQSRSRECASEEGDRALQSLRGELFRNGYRTSIAWSRPPVSP